MSKTLARTTGRSGRKRSGRSRPPPTLAARAAIGAASANEVVAFTDQGLAERADRAGHRWFTYDASYRAWAALAAEAVIDAGAPAAVLDRLADAAPAAAARRRT